MKQRVLRIVSVFMAINLLFEIGFPTVAYALTGGPSQPEVQSFEPVGTTEMVDVSSGDFVYNIPLLDVDGYPINISYHSGITMDQEASWVGLGWNINPGVINRNMRGLPDDFNGDQITKDTYLKPNYTFGLDLGATWELFGFKPNFLKKIGRNLSASWGVFYNNYKGVGFQESITPSITAGNNLKIGGSLAISSNTQSGMSISPSLKMSMSKQMGALSENNGGISVSIGSSVNSRTGTKTLTFSKGLDFSTGGVNYVKKTALKSEDGKKRYGYEMKNDGVASGGASSGGSSISFAGQSYVPQINMSMSSINMSGRFTMGAEIFGTNPDVFISGYFSRQWVSQETVSKNSYGYMYSQNSGGGNDNDVLLDINREKDGAYSKNSPTLPLTTFAYDMYSVSGQGIGGMYRPHRSDVGHVHDDVMESSGGGGSGGFELGVGNVVKWGADINGNYSTSRSSTWTNAEGNNLANVFSFSNKTDPWVNSATYEPVYFKNAGEKTPVEDKFIAFKDMQSAVRPAFKTSGSSLVSETESNKLIKEDGDEISGAKVSNISTTDNTIRSRRDRRNQGIQYLTWAERALFLDKTTSGTLPNQISRLPHHIGEITAVNESGSRYVYGIAAYNISQEEISFTNKHNNSEIESRRNTGLASYYTNYYASKKGEMTDDYDGYYNATTLPAYAHSYLLTAVLSPDYVDVTQNGVTTDDLGTYTKINYTNTQTNYAWRTPYYNAMHNEGLKSDKFDDKGSFTYGLKEIWHVSSIESKNYIAEFEILPREDALGVNDQHGGKNTTKRSYYLNSIALYTKVNHTLVKKVNFEYDYSLCPNVDNNTKTNVTANGVININAGKGKLTLKKIYFTYGNSNKGVLNSYQFTYPPQDLAYPYVNKNPDYDIKGYDRWGNYKLNDHANTTKPLNSEFPYTDQANADTYAQAWSLTQIKLPSGGTINVEYESDDYAYVQNKKAMQMIRGIESGSGEIIGSRILGFGSDQNSTSKSSDRLYSYDSGPNDFIYLHLDNPCANETEFEKKYMPEQIKPWDPTTYLYFNFLIDITHGNKEYIRGYAEIDNNYRSHKIDDNTYSLKLKGVHTGDGSSGDEANQIAKAAWQFARINLPFLVYPGSDMNKSENDDIELVMRSLVGVFFDLAEMFEGINHKLMRNGFGEQVDLSKSWIRLKNADGKKNGGGVRVKRIRLNDNWDNMGGDANSSVDYGQEYDYTLVEDGNEISSGVATYEPMIGNDENPFRQPIMYDKENSLVPDESFYSEEPMGETFFPSPTVTYSTVTVRNLPAPTGDGIVTKHATGKVVHEFYTTRDFPTIVNRTSLQTVAEVPDWISGIFSLKVKNYVTVSQGYQIELNDMNGKQKAQWVYAEPIGSLTEGRRISGVQYFYKTDPNNSQHLNNAITVINNEGSVTDNVMVGVESDMILDTRENESTTISGGLQMNSDNFLVSIFPLFIPTILPSYSSDETRFRSAVITRVIQRYGLLERTVAYQDNSIITTQNMALDAETGEVLLTKTQNEFHDDVYNLTHPAHWAYDGMGLAYRNIGVELSIKVNGGIISLNPPYNSSSPSVYFKPGDEVAITSGTGTGVNTNLYWVHQVGSNLILIDKSGIYISGTNLTVQAKIIRSGARNMQNIPIMQTTTLNVNPIGTGNISLSASTKILNSKADAFSEIWKTNCIQTNTTGSSCIVDVNEMNNLLKYFVNKNDRLDVDVTDGSLGVIDQGNTDDINYAASATKTFLQGCDLTKKFSVVNEISSEDVTVNCEVYDYTEQAWDEEHCYEEQTMTPNEIMQLILTQLGINPNDVTVSVGLTDNSGTTTYTITDNNPPNAKRTFTISSTGVISTSGIDNFNYTDLLTPCDKDYVRINITPFSPGSDQLYKYKCCSTEHHPAMIHYKPGTCIQSHQYRTLGYTFTCGGKTLCAKFKYDEDLCDRGRKVNSISFGGLDASGNTIVNITFEGSTCTTTGILIPCNCPTESYSNCSLGDNPYLPNPYIAGIKGNWRPINSYLYLANRTYTTNIRRDGTYTAYNPFWSVTGAKFLPSGVSDINWVWTSQTVNYLPQGFEVENKDKLGRYNSALFSSTRLPVSVANNAQYREVFVDNFESINNTDHCYGLAYGSNLSTKVSHTGLQSLIVAKNASYEKEFCLTGCNASAEPLCEENCVMPFAPYPGKKYVFAGWVKTQVPLGNVADKDAAIVISFTGTNGVSLSSVSFSSSGTIMEGWQRFEKEIQIPALAKKMKVKLVASAVYNNTWFDDIRIYPYNGNMKAYVYHPNNLKLMAELDENDYASYYEYDEQGALKRIKKETERGVMTIKETRNHMKKSN